MTAKQILSYTKRPLCFTGTIVFKILNISNFIFHNSLILLDNEWKYQYTIQNEIFDAVAIKIRKDFEYEYTKLNYEIKFFLT